MPDQRSLHRKTDKQSPDRVSTGEGESQAEKDEVYSTSVAELLFLELENHYFAHDYQAKEQKPKYKATQRDVKGRESKELAI